MNDLTRNYFFIKNVIFAIIPVRHFKMRTAVLPLLLALFFFSCGSGNNNETTAATDSQTPATSPPAYDNSFAKGIVIDSVTCKNQSSQNFALYLPSSYNSGRAFPCIYIFDAHARGALPLRMYKDLAEKYGFILIGSNISKNGTQWDVTNEGIKTLMEDTRSRINIDPKRIYTAGFSGGSRVASSVAIIDGGIAGVIGCAMGFPQMENAFQNKFDYFGIVGDYDFNLADMMQLNEALTQQGFTHQVVTFNGKHEWAPATDFNTALLWIQVSAMKKNLQPKNDSLVSALKEDFDARISAAASSGDLVKQHLLLVGAINTIGGVSDVSIYQKQDAAITADAHYKSAVVTQSQLQQAEINEQQELAKQFNAQNEKWWAGKIATLNKNARSAKTKEESQMNNRLVNFLGLLGYLSSNHALNVGDLAAAENYLKIFKMADPQNSDCSYLSAIYYVKKGDQPQAIRSLNEAASLGYSDVTQLLSDPSFSTLQNNMVFQNIVSKVRTNRIK